MVVLRVGGPRRLGQGGRLPALRGGLLKLDRASREATRENQRARAGGGAPSITRHTGSLHGEARKASQTGLQGHRAPLTTTCTG